MHLAQSCKVTYVVKDTCIIYSTFVTFKLIVKKGSYENEKIWISNQSQALRLVACVSLGVPAASYDYDNH